MESIVPEKLYEYRRVLSIGTALPCTGVKQTALINMRIRILRIVLS
jgi:hypothetical protein